MSLVDVSELMDDPDFARTFTLRRPTTTLANEGEVSNTYDDADLVGIVQPARPDDVQFLPEGVRLANLISVWSASEMIPGDGTGTLPDVVVVDGQSYRVVKCEPWGGNGYFRVFAEGFVP